MYAKPVIKPDEVFNPKVIYICQTRGCGEDISEFPAAEKNPAPKHCKNCQDKGTRTTIEQLFDASHSAPAPQAA